MSSTTAPAKFVRTLVLMGMTALGAASASAGLTTVNQSLPGNEADHSAILQHLYGGTFAVSGNDFTNGVLTATRCQDSVASDGVLNALNKGPVTTSDQLWTGGMLSGRAIGKFAGYSQSLGYFDGASGGSYHSLFDLSGDGFNVSGSFSGLNMTGKSFRWARGGGGQTFSSLAADNAGEDHMVTYQITGGNRPATWLLCFEDVPAAFCDGDFNDLVVEVSAGLPSLRPPVAIPLPPALWSGLSILVGGGILGSFRRIRRWLI